MGFFKLNEITGVYETSVKNLVVAKRFFDANPTGRIATGIWTDPDWNKLEFYSWFRRSLMYKCGGSEYTERQLALLGDARKINDYIGKRIRHHGTGWLSTPKMQRRYPNIHNQTIE